MNQSSSEIEKTARQDKLYIIKKNPVLCSNQNESSPTIKYMEFICHANETEPYGFLKIENKENLVLCPNVADAIKNYIQTKYNAEAIFCNKPITEIKDDAEMKDGYYVVNNKLYKKIIIKYIPGYVYGSYYEYSFDKLGTFCLSSNENEHGSNQFCPDLFKENILKLITSSSKAENENREVLLAKISNEIFDTIIKNNNFNLLDETKITFLIWSNLQKLLV